MTLANIGSWEFDTVNETFWICERSRAHVNFLGDGVMPYAQLLDLILPTDRENLDYIFQNALSSIEACSIDTQFRVLVERKGATRWLNLKGSFSAGERGQSAHISGIIQDVTELIETKNKFEKSDYQFTSLVDSTPDMITRWNTSLELIFANSLFVNNSGLALSEMLNKPAREIGQSANNARIFVENLVSVIETHIPRYYYSRFLTPAGEIVLYSHLVPEIGSDGLLESVLCISRDVSELKVGEATFQTMIEQAPMAIGLLSGRDMIIDVGNERLFQVWGKPASVTGLPLMQALPEIKGMGFEELLQTVFDTGIPYFGYEIQVKLLREGEFSDVYFDFVYAPIRNTNQKITGVMILATEVSTQVLAKQIAYEAESTLREAIELAELGTWETDFVTGMVDCSDRLRNWLGIKEPGLVSMETIYAAIRPFDHYQLKAALAEAMDRKGTGQYNVEFLVQPTTHIKEMILHARGKVFFDAKGTAIKISGTIQDVTRQRRIELALQQVVHDRTAELVHANEEMAVVNEEYLATNEELLRTNRMLSTSNQSLQQFAYIASHDLQEPLRKIQSFGNMLQSRYGQQLGEGKNYVERMQAASGRMSTLIEDLLSFSNISTNEIQFQSVALNEVIKHVLSDLELVIEESGAIIHVDKLPVIHGDAVQLGRLLQNLLTNAIKFHRPDIAPLIQIDWKIIRENALPENVTPLRHSSGYDRITVTDNGIGFDEQYIQRIFQVFQRLHGKSEFAGTGIGLAICEKVVMNHGGAITASSKVGQGSAFSVYFPIVGKH